MVCQWLEKHLLKIFLKGVGMETNQVTQEELLARDSAFQENQSELTIQIIKESVQEQKVKVKKIRSLSKKPKPVSRIAFEKAQKRAEEKQREQDRIDAEMAKLWQKKKEIKAVLEEDKCMLFTSLSMSIGGFILDVSKKNKTLVTFLRTALETENTPNSLSLLESFNLWMEKDGHQC
jgi:DNA-binding transcriptional MerR regulator